MLAYVLGITKWGKKDYKLGQVLGTANQGKKITNQGRDFKAG